MTTPASQSSSGSVTQDCFEYGAFISYNHKNRKWGKWLMDGIESYPLPPALLPGFPESRKGHLKVFRDRDELPSGSNLTEVLKAALRASRHLVVICSPEAAQSVWVNKEVAYFKSLGRDDRVHCLIIAGEPNAMGKAGRRQECYPPAVRFRVDADGELTDEGAPDGIAGDARRHGDGKRKAKIKIIAGLLGVKFDALWQREKRRLFWSRVQTVTATVAVIGLVASVWEWQARAAREERVQQMTDRGLGELSQNHADSALVYLSTAYSAGGDSPSLKFLLRRAELELPNISSSGGGREVFSAVFNRTDSRVVTASKDNTARVYDAANGQLLATLRSSNCVNSAIFSPDDTEILTASNDGIVRLWNAIDRGEPSPVALFKHSPGKSVETAVFSPNGELVATCGAEDALAKVWRANSKNPVPMTIFTNHLHGKITEGIERIRFSSNGTMIVTAGRRDHTARVWDPLTGSELWLPMVLSGEDGLRDAVPSPDGSLVVACSYTGEAVLWRSNGVIVRQLIAPMANNCWTRRATFSPDGSHFVTASSDGKARVFESGAGKLLFELPHAIGSEEQRVFMATYSGDGRAIATAGANKMVKLWDAATGNLWSTLTNHTEFVVSAEFSHDNTRLSTAGYDGYAYIWDVSDVRAPKLITPLVPDQNSAPVAAASSAKSVATILPNHARYVVAARFSPDAMRVATIDAVGAVRLWTTTNGNLISQFPAEGGVADVAFGPDGDELATVGENGRLTLWTISSKNESVTAAFETNLFQEIKNVHFGSSNTLVIASDDQGGRIIVFDPQRRHLRSAFEGVELAVSKDGSRILVRSDTNDAVAWTYAADGSRITTFSSNLGAFVCASFSHDCKRLATATTAGRLIVWNESGQQLFPPEPAHPGSDIFCVNFSPDDRFIVSLGSDNQADVWDSRDGHLLGALKTLPNGESKYLRSVETGSLTPAAAFSADGAFVSTSSFERFDNVWDLASGSLLAHFPGHTGNVTTVAFSPVKNLLLTGALDGTARIWNLEYETNSPRNVSDFVHSHLHKHLEGEIIVSDK